MIHNQKGVTLVEMLAVLTIASVCFALIFGIWLSGEKSAARTMTENDLQADAHLVQSRLTTAFYNQNEKPFTVTVNDGQVEITYENSAQPEIISDSDLLYRVGSTDQPASVDVHHSSTLALDYLITQRNDPSGDGPSFHLKTTLNYPWTDNQGGGSP